MGKFQAWFSNFMRGRYGYDDLTRTLFTAVIAVLIVSIVCNLLGHFGGSLFYVISSVTNFIGTILIFYALFRVFSRNHVARRAENERFLARKRNVEQKRGSKDKGTAGRDRQQTPKKDEANYKYLDCPHCHQAMRVPRGKGKIAVKCPKCGESTITES